MEDLEINRNSEVRSKHSLRRRSTIIKNDGYEYIRVTGGRAFRVHRLVAEVFKTKPHPDADIIDHINGTRVLNHVENLQFITQRQNVVFGSGCPAVAINNVTGEVVIFDYIQENCIEASCNLPYTSNSRVKACTVKWTRLDSHHKNTKINCHLSLKTIQLSKDKHM